MHQLLIGKSCPSSTVAGSTTAGVGARRTDEVFELAHLIASAMGDWISDVLLFSAGITGGILIMTIVSSFRLDKRRQSELVAARARVLADIKQQHDQEILDAVFRTTEDIQGELNTSLQRLRKTVSTALQPASEEPTEPPPHTVTKN